ncbi:hypothetical protein ABFT23_09630 [Nocardioides sp. C4-1]|uniref:hypothetical protein n=1 Tax=Nocardioides sp. C4-1 TaxID=3151851 RepID=UPI0032666724
MPTSVKLLAAIAALCLLGAAVSLLWRPSIRFTSGFTVKCQSTTDALGGEPAAIEDDRADVTDGRSAYDDLVNSEVELDEPSNDLLGLGADAGYARDVAVAGGIASACSARHTELTAQGLGVSVVGVLAASGAMSIYRTSPRRPRPPRPGTYVPPDVPSG